MYGYDEDRDWYDVQEVCLNGHLITNYAQSQPESRRAHCSSCGEKTISACLSCSAPLRGYHHMPGVIHFGSDDVDRFCDSCGALMPWTERGLTSVLDIAAMSEALSETEQETLRDTVRALMVPSGQTEVAALKLRKVISRLDEYERAALLRTLKVHATEAAREALGLVDAPAAAPSKRRR